MSFFGSFLKQKAPFFLSRMSFWRFDRKKEANDGKKKKRKKKDASFFESRFSQGLISGRGEAGRNKTSAPLSSRTHFHLFGSAPIFPRGVFSKPPNPCRSPCLGPTPSTDEKRQLKDDKPGIPMIGSRVALAFHSGYRRPQNCFSVCTKGKIQNTILVL